MGKDTGISPMERALMEVYRELKPAHKGQLLGVAEELRLAEITPRRKSKKASAVPKRSGEEHPI